MEYCSGGTLKSLMKQRGGSLLEFEIASILRMTLTGLQYLHDQHKIHRDIKPANILLHDYVCKLAVGSLYCEEPCSCSVTYFMFTRLWFHYPYAKREYIFGYMLAVQARPLTATQGMIGA